MRKRNMRKRRGGGKDLDWHAARRREIVCGEIESTAAPVDANELKDSSEVRFVRTSDLRN